MKPDEVHALPAWCLRLIILVEARAAPRLRTVEGLWRKSTRTRPWRMTEFIRAEALRPGAEIDAIIRDAPTDLVRFQDIAAHIPLPARAAMSHWPTAFNARLTTAQRHFRTCYLFRPAPVIAARDRQPSQRGREAHHRSKGRG